jgi:hypothetical protein
MVLIPEPNILKSEFVVNKCLVIKGNFVGSTGWGDEGQSLNYKLRL